MKDALEGVLGMSKPYQKIAAERLAGLLNETQLLEVRDDGVYFEGEVSSPLEAISEAAGLSLTWNPQCAFPDSEARQAPFLPIPFSVADLAAFLLCPVVAGWDEDYMRGALSGTLDGFARQAFESALTELQRAEQRVGSRNGFPNEKASSLARECEAKRNAARERLGILEATGHGLSDEEYRSRIEAANAEVADLRAAADRARIFADKHDADWRNRMVHALFDPAHDDDADALSRGVETGDQRRARRYQMCIDHGLSMPDNDYARLPDGIKEVAALEGISAQAFSKDVKKHIAQMGKET